MRATKILTTPPRRGLGIALAVAGFGLLTIIGLVVVTAHLTRQTTLASTQAEAPATASNALDPEGPLATLATTVDTQQARLETQSTLIAEQQQRLAVLRTRLDDVAAQTAERQAQTTHLQNQLSEVTTSQSQIAHQLQSLQTQIQAGQGAQTALTTVREAARVLRGEQQKMLYRVNVLEAKVTGWGQQLMSLQRALEQSAAPQNASVPGKIITAPPLPFSVTAVDHWASAPTITVAEPPLAGKRRTRFLQPGESHRGWTFTQIKDGTVIFTHPSGTTITTAISG